MIPEFLPNHRRQMPISIRQTSQPVNPLWIWATPVGICTGLIHRSPHALNSDFGTSNLNSALILYNFLDISNLFHYFLGESAPMPELPLCGSGAALGWSSRRGSPPAWESSHFRKAATSSWVWGSSSPLSSSSGGSGHGQPRESSAAMNLSIVSCQRVQCHWGTNKTWQDHGTKKAEVWDSLIIQWFLKIDQFR